MPPVLWPRILTSLISQMDTRRTWYYYYESQPTPIHADNQGAIRMPMHPDNQGVIRMATAQQPTCRT